MHALTRTLLGPLAGALLVAFACSEPSTPGPDWNDGSDGVTPEGGKPPSNAGGASNGGGTAGSPASGASNSAGSLSSSAGKSGAGGKAGGSGATAGTGGKAGGSGATAGTGGKGGSSAAGKGGAASAGRDGSPGSAGETGSSGETGSAGDGPTGDFFGESRCSDDLDFCDDFEGDEVKSEYSPQGAVPQLETTRAARGSQSAHFTTTGNAVSVLRYSFAEARPSYYARLFVWFEALPTAPMWAHWSIAGAIGDGTEAEIRVGGQFDGETNRFGVGTDHGETGDWTLLSEEQNAVPTGRWICVEWLHDADANETRFWSDGVEHESLHTTATRHGADEGTYELPEFTEVFVGWWHYQPNPTPNRFNVWIDEVAIDDEPIGCTR